MPNPLMPPEYDLSQRIKAIENILANLTTSPSLLNASTGQGNGSPGLTTDTNGLHLFNSAGVEQATLKTVDGSANFNGNVNINGNLSVPNGSISNAALLNPIYTGSVGGSDSGWAIGTGTTQHAPQTITVPAGYTKATVWCFASVSGYNQGTGSDYLYVSAYAGSGSGGESVMYAGNGTEVSATATAINTFTGLSGGTITVASQVRSGSTTWAASAFNSANTNAIVIFTR